MKTTSLDPENDSTQDLKACDQIADSPNELLFLMDQEEREADEASIEP